MPCAEGGRGGGGTIEGVEAEGLDTPPVFEGPVAKVAAAAANTMSWHVNLKVKHVDQLYTLSSLCIGCE